MKKRKGTALVLVICVFFVLIMMGVIVTTYAANNIHQVRMQMHRQQAYYAVYSGLDLGLSGIYQPRGGQDQYLLNLFKDPVYTNSLELTDHVMLLDESSENLSISVDIRVRATTHDGVTPCPDGEEIWVEIYVVGNVVADDTTVSHAGIIRVSTTDPALTVRELEAPQEIN